MCLLVLQVSSSYFKRNRPCTTQLQVITDKFSNTWIYRRKRSYVHANCTLFTLLPIFFFLLPWIILPVMPCLVASDHSTTGFSGSVLQMMWDNGETSWEGPRQLRGDGIHLTQKGVNLTSSRKKARCSQPNWHFSIDLRRRSCILTGFSVLPFRVICLQHQRLCPPST